MATTTKQSSKTTAPKVHPLVARQQELIGLFTQETQTMHELAEAYRAALAKEENDGNLTNAEKETIKKYRSASGRKANRSKEIGQIELDMRLANADGGEQIEFTKFVAPKNGNGTRKRPSASKEQIEADLVKVGAIYNTADDDDDVKHDCDVRIDALLRQAKKAGYEVTDPRVTA